MSVLAAFGVGLLGAVGGYLLGALGAALCIKRFSANRHDKSLEAAMTSIFVIGPAGALLGFVAALAWALSR